MILVTGAAGRLGRRVVLRLIDKGYCVLGTDREAFEDSPSPVDGWPVPLFFT